MKDLARRIQDASTRLTVSVVADMYRNPFWDERFGARGRTRAVEDGGHHLSYLAEALAKLFDAEFARRFIAEVLFPDFERHE